MHSLSLSLSYFYFYFVSYSFIYLFCLFVVVVLFSCSYCSDECLKDVHKCLDFYDAQEDAEHPPTACHEHCCEHHTKNAIKEQPIQKAHQRPQAEQKGCSCQRHEESVERPKQRENPISVQEPTIAVKESTKKGDDEFLLTDDMLADNPDDILCFGDDGYDFDEDDELTDSDSDESSSIHSLWRHLPPAQQVQMALREFIGESATNFIKYYDPNQKPGNLNSFFFSFPSFFSFSFFPFFYYYFNLSLFFFLSFYLYLYFSL